MKIFFDTEFTGLRKNTSLISIGLIDENGRTFYAEFSDYDESQCDEWIKENVIKNLKLPNGVCLNYNDEYTWCNVKGDKLFIKNALNKWFSKYDEIQLVSDVCHYDMVLFIDIFGGAFNIPKNVNPACHDINQDIATYYCISEREAFDMSREEIVKSKSDPIEGDKHNALYDAKVIKRIYDIIYE